MGTTLASLQIRSGTLIDVLGTFTAWVVPRLDHVQTALPSGTLVLAPMSAAEMILFFPLDGRRETCVLILARPKVLA